MPAVERVHLSPRGHRSRCFASLCLILALVFVALAATRSDAARPGAATPASLSEEFLPEPISGVILADESGTQTPASIRAERDAAAALVESDPSMASQYMIAGFASQNRRGQHTVAPYCDFIKTSSPAARASLAACAANIRGRTQAQGWDTDLAQALEFAIQQLRGRRGLKVIFLMTDGKLDVSSSPMYGRVPSLRTREAMRILEQQVLPAARAAGIQVWPLGFGPDASDASLEPFAVGAGGVNRRCASAPASRPRAMVVTDFSQLTYRLVSAQTSARCASVSDPSRGNLEPGGAITLRVRIPAIASYGALTVVTGNPQVRAVFIAPNGVEVPRDGSVDGQTLHQTGAGTDVLTLRIVNPLPGLWTVKLAAPPRLVAQTRVTAFASWQGVLSASLFVSPVQAIPGQPVNINLHVLSRSGVVVGPALSSLTANAWISGAFGRIAVPLRVVDNAAFRGTVTLPKGATGDVVVSGRVSGTGIAGDQTSTTILTQSYDFLSAVFDVEVPRTVHPGSLLRGEVTTINQGAPTRGILRLNGFSPGALVTLAARPVPIPSGTSTASFTLRVSPDTEIGPAFVSVVLARKSDGKTISGTTVDMRIVAAPSWWDDARLWVIPAGVLLLLVAVVLAVRARVRAAGRVRAADTQGLTATLLVDGASATPALSSDGGETFRLSLIADGLPQLVHADVAGASGIPIAIRRTDHSASIAAGEGEPRECRFGELIALGPGLALRVDAQDLEVIQEHDPDVGEVPARHNNACAEDTAVAARWR